MASLASFARVCNSVICNSEFGQPATAVRSLRNMRQALFCFKPQKGKRLMSGRAVTLIIPGGQKQFTCPDDETIYDQAKANGIRLPSECRQRGDGEDCGRCAGKRVNGAVEQPGARLSEEQEDNDYVLTCVAYPQSDDVVIDMTKKPTA